MPNGDEWGAFGNERTFDDATTFHELWDKLSEAAIEKGLLEPEEKFDPQSSFNQDWAEIITDEEGNVKDHPDRPQDTSDKEKWGEYADFLKEWDLWDEDRENWDYE